MGHSALPREHDFRGIEDWLAHVRGFSRKFDGERPRRRNILGILHAVLTREIMNSQSTFFLESGVEVIQ